LRISTREYGYISAEIDWMAFLKDIVKVPVLCRSNNDKLIETFCDNGESYVICVFYELSGVYWDKSNPSLWNETVFYKWLRYGSVARIAQTLFCKEGERIGEIDLRIGYTDGLYYGGQIGYSIDEKYRGNGYAGRACRLLLPVAKAHGMTKLLITNNHENTASMRVYERLGCRLVRVARMPEWHDLYKEGRRFQNIFEWSMN